MTEISPLHRVIDAGRWEAERLLGRLIIVIHAAFLDTGFVSHTYAAPPKSGRVPRRVGATASTLSLRYAAPGLRDAVVLRMSAHGMRIVFYVRVRSDQGRGPGLHWACVDARAAAPLLSGGLDDTARALTSHGACGDGLAALWSELTEKLCRGALVDLRRENAFVLLPNDIILAILARLVEGLDLLRVASTCAELRRLVANHDRELWKHRLSSACGDDSMSWMERWCCCCKHKHTRFAQGIGLSSMKEDYRKHLEGLDQSIMARLYLPNSQSTNT